MVELNLKSAAFDNKERIPVRYTGEGQNTSPPLYWTDVPAGTSSFVVFCHDPDAPLVSGGGYGFVHWVVYNIPFDVRGFREGEEPFTSGKNDGGSLGYIGPYPPEFHGIHNYYFIVLALDSVIDEDVGLNLREILERVEGHVVGMARLIGTYER